MALTNTQIAIFSAAFVVFFAVVAQVIATISGTSIFNLASNLFKTEEKKTYKQKKIPDDKQFILTNPSRNFRQKINGIIISGNDPKTGIEMLRFNYGDDKVSDFSVPNDPAYFRIAEPGKLNDITKLVIEIADADTYARMKTKLDNTNLFSKGLEYELREHMDGQKIQLQKTVDLIKEEKRVAFGWTGTQQSGTSIWQNRPWSSFNRFAGMNQQNEEEQL